MAIYSPNFGANPVDFYRILSGIGQTINDRADTAVRQAALDREQALREREFGLKQRDSDLDAAAIDLAKGLMGGGQASAAPSGGNLASVGRSVVNPNGVPLGPAAAIGGIGPALARVFQFEGGKGTDTNGGAVNFGINQKANPDVDVNSLTEDMAAGLYRNRYWNAIGGDELAAKNPALAHVAMDAAVNSGPDKAMRWIALSGGDPNKFLDLRQSFLEQLAANNPQKFGPDVQKAWADRIATLRQDVANAGQPGAAPQPPEPFQVAQAGNGAIPVPQPRPADLGQPQATAVAPDVPSIDQAPGRTAVVDPFVNVPPKLKAALPALMASPKTRGMVDLLLKQYPPPAQPSYERINVGGVAYLRDTSNPSRIFLDTLQDPNAGKRGDLEIAKLQREASDPLVAGFTEARDKGLIPADMKLSDYAKLKQPGTTIKNEGTIPPGFRAKRDADGNVIELEPIPGSKEANAIENQKKAQTDTANTVIDAIDRIDKRMSGTVFPTTGIGSLAASVPGTPAHDVSQLISTIQANIGFDKLNAMRQQSPTGAALGNVTERETKLLQDTVAALGQSQSEDQFRENLQRVRDRYSEIINGPAKGGTGAKGAPVSVPKTMTNPREIMDYLKGQGLKKGDEFTLPDGRIGTVP